MNIFVIIISIMVIAIVLLQAGKAEAASFNGASDSMFANRKERGGELFITRLTAVLGAIFMIICLVLNYI